MNTPLRPLLFTAVVVLFAACEAPKRQGLTPLVEETRFLPGKTEYLASRFVAAGDRAYLIGHQDGTFPDLGWHVAGEMGGIWDHPIKLMDAFSAALVIADQTYCLDSARSFENYPFANIHRYAPVLGIETSRMQFVPDGMEAVVVEFAFKNTRDQDLPFEFVFNGMSDLRPVWLGERTGMVDAPDSVYWDAAANCMVAKDGKNPWFALWGGDGTPAGHLVGSAMCSFERKGTGASGEVRYQVKVKSGETVYLPVFIAGSYTSLEAAKATFSEVKRRPEALLAAKRDRYAAIERTARVTLPDSTLQLALEWVKYSTDWLIRDVPEQGRGLSAGLDDYPWWFGCDNEYSLPAVLATGQDEIVYTTLRLLADFSEKTNGNGRMVHEVSTNGAVFNPGNVNETPQFASLVWAAYTWTGDRELLEDYFPLIEKGLDWLLKENDADGNLCPDGFGMMEIHGLNSEMIDVATYTQRAFADAARMAQVLGKTELSQRYQQIADTLRTRINTDFWSEEFASYADFIGTARQADHLIADALVRADTLGKPWAVAELQATRRRIATYPPDKKQAFVLYHNWVVNTPMETGIADREKALAALETGRRFVNPFGMFVTGIDRDESAGSDDGSFAKGKKIFSYTGAVMTLPTGVQAIAENNYGRPDSALGYLRRLTRSFGYALPGSMYEVSPDFGMMAQAWNVYALVTPVVTQFFGFQPSAHERKLRLSPGMPSAWPYAQLENLPVGDNTVNLRYDKTAEGVRFAVNHQRADWPVVIRQPKGRHRQWLVNGQPVTPEVAGDWEQVTVSGKDLVVEWR